MDFKNRPALVTGGTGALRPAQSPGGGDLRQQVHTETGLGQHTFYAPHLAADAAQAKSQALLGIRIQHDLCSHSRQVQDAEDYPYPVDEEVEIETVKKSFYL